MCDTRRSSNILTRVGVGGNEALLRFGIHFVITQFARDVVVLVPLGHRPTTKGGGAAVVSLIDLETAATRHTAERAVAVLVEFERKIVETSSDCVFSHFSHLLDPPVPWARSR